jgi:hypothetical protein
MSSSSSDSDSDDFEPIRRIKINIKPKDAVKPSDTGADVEAIKASVEAWRPLGPRPHPSLSRRQSSLSSVSSLTSVTTPNSNHGSVSGKPVTVESASASTNQNQYYNQSSFGATKSNMIMNNYTNSSIRSSPSCSSLVNEFTNRTSFSNFMPNASRTSSPLTLMGSSANRHSETVPIALAIQESIEVTVKGQHKPAFHGNNAKVEFETRALGNIKVAFPNSFARLCSLGGMADQDGGVRQIPNLKLMLHSTENIIRYYASGLIKDLDSERSSLAESVNTLSNGSNNNNNNHCGNSNSTNVNESKQQWQNQRQNFEIDLFDLNESPTKVRCNNKIIEFDMDALINHLKQLYEKSPNMRYYNADVLRYQIAPIDEFEKCPLQVCAYWKLEPRLIKLRLDFKHSNQSGFNLERLREISFTAYLNNLVPPNCNIKPVLTFEPQAIWDDTTRQLKWKFDNLLAFYKNDGSGSLLAKIDFRHCDEIPVEFFETMTSSNDPSQNRSLSPQPIDIKFMVVDSTLSKIGLAIDSIGYRMSLLKKEVRSGRYRSEPCTF